MKKYILIGFVSVFFLFGLMVANNAVAGFAIDTTAPTVTVPDDYIVEATSGSGAILNYVASATDINPATPEVTCVPPSGSTFPLGTTTVTCSATDSAGNIGTDTFTVQVITSTDTDGDGVLDLTDNCPLTINTDQLDDDHDGIGKACDAYMCISTGIEIGGDTLDNDCDGLYDEVPTEASPTVEDTQNDTSDTLDWWTTDFNFILENIDFGSSGKKSAQFKIDDGSWQNIVLSVMAPPSSQAGETWAYIHITQPGEHTVNVVLTNNADRTFTNSYIVRRADTLEISSVYATAPNTVEITFNKELQNNETHKPRISDFDVYNPSHESSYEIESVSYENMKVTIILTETDPIESGDTPRLYIYGESSLPSTLIDLSGNYFNNGFGFDAPVLDRIIPIITLNGEAVVNLTVGDIYEDAGATCTDIVDETCEVISTGTVDTNTAGTYTITYNTTDSAENDATPVTRTVNVVEVQQSHGGSSGSYLPGYGPNAFKPTVGQVLGAEKYNFTLLLKMGSIGNEVMELQKFLNNAGYGVLAVDGAFGPLTKAEVIKFQLANGLVGDGIVGPLTRAVLNK